MKKGKKEKRKKEKRKKKQKETKRTKMRKNLCDKIDTWSESTLTRLRKSMIKEHLTTFNLSGGMFPKVKFGK